MGKASAEDWVGVENALRELTDRIAKMRMGDDGGETSPTEAPFRPAPSLAPVGASSSLTGVGSEDFFERKRVPSIFATPFEKSEKQPGQHHSQLLGHLYTPNIFAMDYACDAGVEDDVDDLQLRVAYRLRRREEALQAKDMSDLKNLQAAEMREADQFMQAFDAQQWLQHRGPALPSGQGAMAPPSLAAASRSASACASGRSNAGPLPAPREPQSVPRWPPLRPPACVDLSDELLGAAADCGVSSRCPRCSSVYAADSLFCRRCGQKRDEAGPADFGPSWLGRPQPSACWSPALADVLAAGGWAPPPPAWPRF
eukprot:gb/GFBE01061205.1/.p1 GENE.gb/GFBE01061205.1/~~gb/GFBE01061205.1/.p1  ORF type:complete len:313 (+),score=38.75 gb/GFBE01061205.1/:1-939(+)